MANDSAGAKGALGGAYGATNLPPELFGLLPHRRTVPDDPTLRDAQVCRDEILDGRTRIAGYRFRVVSTAAGQMSAVTKLKALKADHLATFAEHRMAVVPITAEEWRKLDYRQFVTPNTTFHVAPPADPTEMGDWLDTLRDIKASGAALALDLSVAAADATVLDLARMVFVDRAEYSAQGFERELEALHGRHRGIEVAALEVESWDRYRSCLDMGIHYCLGSFTSTPYSGDATHERAAIDDVLDCKLVQFHWYRVFECGQAQIDHDHRLLFALANDLLTGMVAGRDFEKTCEAVDRLLAEVQAHFHREEALIEAAGYAHSAKHASLHQTLLEMAAKLVSDYKAGRAQIGSVFEFLAGDLIVKHMLGADRDFFPVFQKHYREAAPTAAR